MVAALWMAYPLLTTSIRHHPALDQPQEVILQIYPGGDRHQATGWRDLTHTGCPLHTGDMMTEVGAGSV
eukprot:gene14739-14908_t